MLVGIVDSLVFMLLIFVIGVVYDVSYVVNFDLLLMVISWVEGVIFVVIIIFCIEYLFYGQGVVIIFVSDVQFVLKLKVFVVVNVGNVGVDDVGGLRVVVWVMLENVINEVKEVLKSLLLMFDWYGINSCLDVQVFRLVVKGEVFLLIYVDCVVDIC